MTGCELLVKKGGLFAMTKVPSDGYLIQEIVGVNAVKCQTGGSLEGYVRGVLADYCLLDGEAEFLSRVAPTSRLEDMIYTADVGEHGDIQNVNDAVAVLDKLTEEVQELEAKLETGEQHPYNTLACGYSDYVVFHDLDRNVVYTNEFTFEYRGGE